MKLKEKIRSHALFTAALGLALVVNLTSQAASLSLVPSADTMLSQTYQQHNFGAMPFFNSGTTQNSNYNRGLIQFDLTNNLPPRARIISATLTLEVVGNPDEVFPSSRFNLHRMLVPWGEGAGTNSPGGGLGHGTLATTNEATWLTRFAFTTNTWTQPGGHAPEDFVLAPSTGITMGGVAQSPYTMPSSPEMVADLQAWLDHPEANFGWAVVCLQETTKFTARRLGSREDPLNAPRLDLEYLIAPQLESPRLIGNQIELAFTAAAGQSYVVEYRDNVANGEWLTLTNHGMISDNERVVAWDALTGQARFYRVVTE